MARIKKNNKEEFDWIFELCQQQSKMLCDSEEALSQLYKICDNNNQKYLLKDLITRFKCLDEDIKYKALIGIAKYIKSLGYARNEMAIVAFAHDHKADGSQLMLQELKVPLAIEGVSNPNMINRFDRIEGFYNQGIRHFIAIDEFAGSGKTLLNRHKEFLSKRLNDATIEFCFIAAMDDTIELANQNGICLHVEYNMEKGISQHYKGPELELYTEEMTKLESKLAPAINETILTDYNFGYGKAESLFSILHGNVPNNVFPIFWWKMDSNCEKRITLFTRVQDGY